MMKSSDPSTESCGTLNNMYILIFRARFYQIKKYTLEFESQHHNSIYMSIYV